MRFTPRLRSTTVAVALLAMALVNGSLLWRARVPMAQGYGDFANFYSAGILVRRGLGSELYNASAQWKVQQEFSSQVTIRRGPMRYMRPPFEALFFALFAARPYARALLLWTGVQLALLASIPFIVAGGRTWREGFPLWVTPLLVLGTFPGFINFLMGQDALLLAWLVAISFRQLALGKDAGAGFTLGLALFKFQLAIPLVVILWIAGRKRILPGFAVAAALVLALSAALVGWRGLLQYPGYLLTLNQATGVGIAPQNQMTLRGLLTLFVGRLPYPGPIHWVLAPIAVAMIVYTGLLWRKAGDCFLSEGFGLACVVAIVTSYYANSYDLLLLIVPLLAVRTRPDGVHDADTDKVTQYLEAGGLLLLLLTPLYWFAKFQLDAECLMTLPLLAVGVGLERRLRHPGAVTNAVPMPRVPDEAG